MFVYAFLKYDKNKIILIYVRCFYAGRKRHLVSRREKKESCIQIIGNKIQETIT
jgi:hypothetical protein